MGLRLTGAPPSLWSRGGPSALAAAARVIDSAILSQSLLLDGLDPALAKHVASVTRQIQLANDEILFFEGDESDGLYAILDGAVRVSVVSDEGEERILTILCAGDIVGELGLIDGGRRSARVTAARPTRLAFVPKSGFERVADSNPAIYRHMLRLVGDRLREANIVRRAQDFLPLQGRVAQTMLRLATAFGRPVDGGRTLIHHKITHASIASMVGVARENVSRTLSVWQRDKLISRISGYYCIEDAAALHRMAHSEDA
jgi:CRP-like cAMP-binding protein